MVHPFEVTPEEVERLDADQLQTLVNRLVEIEVTQARLSVDVLVASDRTDDKDGGIDARIHDPEFPGSEFLPAGSSVWQAKSGKSRWPNYEEELQKERVRKAVDEGKTYIMVLGRQLNPLQYDAQRNKLRTALDEISPNASFEIRSAGQIAKWMTRYPALWHLLRRPPSPFWNVHEFLAQQELHDVEYFWSPSTETLRDAVRTQLIQSPSTTPLRIHGRAGVGKSRLVLETFAEPPDTAVYVPFAGDLTMEVLSWMRDRPGLTATLVVDECDLSEAQRIQTYISSAKGSLRLVTVGTEPPPDLQNHFEVGPMTDDVVRAVVGGVHPEITHEQREWIVAKSRGFVKLARSLAGLVRRSAVNLATMDVPGLLGEMFSDEDRDALTVVALLSHIGWEEEHEREGETLSKHMGMKWSDCRRVVRRLERRGYIGRTGRYRYVTPELLAIWFAAEEWGANRTGLLSIFSQASPAMADRMSNRLRQMPHVDEVADLAREVLGPNGPFRDLAILNHPRNARLFGDFSRIAPSAAIEALDRAFEAQDTLALHLLDGGRREVVWTLERLVAQRELFPAAARLLLRLAVAENEHFANNATGVFQSLFNPTGRATAATGDVRLDLLSEIASTADEEELLIAIGALKEVFDMHGGYTISADLGGQLPPPAWIPKSWEEHTSYCRRAFAFLVASLTHDSEPVRAAAETAALEQFRSFFWLGLGDEALDLASRSDLAEGLRRRLGINADDVITYDHDKPFMTEELLKRLRNLSRTIYGDPLRERLHLGLGTWNRELRRAVRDSSENFLEAEAREIKSLVTDLLREQEVLRDEFAWITSEEAVKGQQFIGYLGEQDPQREWLAPVLEASLERDRPDLISSYVFGLSLASSNSDVEVLLDEWAFDAGLRRFVPHITASLGLTEQRVLRLLAMLHGGLDPQSLTCLTWTRCESDLSLDTLAFLLRAMATAGQAARSAVWTILNNDISRRPEAIWNGHPGAQDLLWELVGNADVIGDYADGHASYSWSECAKPLVAADAKRLVAAVVSAVQSEREHLYAGSYVRKVLDACFEADPIGAWTAYADAVGAISTSSWLLTTWGAEAGITEQVGVDDLQRWVEEAEDQTERRAELIAKLTTVDTELTPVIRWIVTHFEESQEVLDSLMVQHGVRTVWGGRAAAEQPRLDAARKWTEEDQPAIRRWARRVIEDLDQMVERYRIEDDESELRR